ncbi:MAG TPA: hypothetical protein VGN18_02325 [Jatrophihabitans sp.]|jgi:hypothetical protein|uniref:hypothetical protein n=1 Tax=Jatrophihabitans sp. TaxID=1932789 RepID=UPI002E010118|nr:hypothetical protein [Jatrophihabitans sp.]
MPAYLVPSGTPWIDPAEVTTSTTFALSIPVRNDGDEAAGMHDVVVLDLTVDYAPDHKSYHVTAVGAEPGQEYSGTVHVAGGELDAGTWHVSARNQHDSGYSEHRLTFEVTE